MSVSLVKGGNVSLTKQAPGLTNVVVGLGWDARTTDGQPFDLDASAIACGADGKVLSNSHFVFFNNLKSPDGFEDDRAVVNIVLEAIGAPERPARTRSARLRRTKASSSR